MNNTVYDTVFEDFLVNIALTASQAKRIDSSIESLHSIFKQELGEGIEIYPQGSFATGTTVKPLTENQTNGNPGEYDVDLALDQIGWQKAKDSLLNVEEILQSNGYAEQISPKKRESCERVNYKDEKTGVGYHVDLVPIKTYGDNKKVALRSDNEWKTSNPHKVIEWFNDLCEAQPFIRPQVLVLKRMRDYAGLTERIPSIVILALVGELYENQGSYADDLLSVISNIMEKFKTDLKELEIVIPGVEENLSEKFTEESYKVVKEYLVDVWQQISEGFRYDNFSKLRHILSDDFPLEKYPEELHSFRLQDWTLELNGYLKRGEITPNPKPSDLSKTEKKILKFMNKNQEVVFHGKEQKTVKNADVRWQVLNARGSEQIRGDFFRARKQNSTKPSSNKLVNYETVCYKGTHWIRYVAIKNKKVILVSEPYYVQGYFEV